MLLEPGECECVTLLGQIIPEIDTGSEEKKSPVEEIRREVL